MFVERLRRDRPEIPTASLADMAFLLIIFFIVITRFGTDKGIDLLLPPEGAIQEIPRQNIVAVVLDDAGAVSIDGVRFSMNQVQNTVQAAVSKNDRLVVTVKFTRVTPYPAFVSVMDQLKGAHVRKISVLEPER